MSEINNSYFTDKKKSFAPQPIPKSQFVKAFKFAYDMTFGKMGEHRAYRSGGQYSRKNGELFANTLQGKLGEFGLYTEFIRKGIALKEPDLETWKLGKWDENDFIINGNKLSVKSTAFFSNLLLLETKDWDNNGVYLPNNSSYDFTVLVRIKPDLKQIMKSHRIYYCNEIEINELNKIISNEDFSFDIPGFITVNDLKFIITNRFILPQNSLLNGKTKMDASNYYVQAGDLLQLNLIFDKLK